MALLDQFLAGLRMAQTPWAQRQLARQSMGNVAPMLGLSEGAAMAGPAYLPPPINDSQDRRMNAGAMTRPNPGQSMPMQSPQPRQMQVAQAETVQPDYIGGALKGASQANSPVGMILGLLGGGMSAGQEAEAANKRAAKLAEAQNMTYQALIKRRVSPEEARAAIANPEMLQAILKQTYAANDGERYGKTGSIFQDPESKQFYSIQWGADGTRRIEPLTGLTPSRGVAVEGAQMFDKATGEPVRDMSAPIAEAERQKVLGKASGEGTAFLPKAETALKQYDMQTESILKDIDLAVKQAGPWTTGFVGNLASYVAGTPQHDLSKTLLAIQSNLGFETLQQMRDNSPTGGALGQVTEKEIELLQSTWGSIAQSQSEDQFKANLKKIADIKREYRRLKREAYQKDVARFGAQNVPNPDAGAAGTPASETGENPYKARYGLE